MEAAKSDSSATVNTAQDVHESRADFNDVSSSPKDEAVTAAKSSESSDAASDLPDGLENTTVSASIAAIQADDASDSNGNKDEAVVSEASSSGPYAAADNMQEAPEDINGAPSAQVSLPKNETLTEVDSSEPTAAASHKKDDAESCMNSEGATSLWPPEDAVAASAEMRAIAEDVYDALVDDSTAFQWFEDAKTPEEREKALEVRTSRKRAVAEYGKWTCPVMSQPRQANNLGFHTDGIVFHGPRPTPLNNNVAKPNATNANEKNDRPVTGQRQPPPPVNLDFPPDGIVFHDPLPTLLNDNAAESNAINKDKTNDRPVADHQAGSSSAPAHGNVSQVKSATAAPSATESRQPNESAPVESAEKSTPAELGSALDGLSVVLTRILRDEEAVRMLVDRGHLNPLLQEVLKLESGEVYCTGGCGRVRRE